MKKNIEKPELSEETRTTLASQVQSIFIMSQNCRKMSWRDTRKFNKYKNRVIDLLLFGDWELALRSLWAVDGFDAVFAKSVELLKRATADDLPGLSIEEVENVQLGTRKLPLIYEYMTGKDMTTGKKLHKGALDAED